MTTPPTGRAEDLKRPCRNHSQENPPASIWAFFHFLLMFKTIVLHKKGKPVAGRQEAVSNSNAVSGLTLLVFLPFSLIKVTPMQLIPRNTDGFCRSLTHTEPALFIMYFPVAGKQCFYSSTSRLRSNALNKRWFWKHGGL